MYFCPPLNSPFGTFEREIKGHGPAITHSLIGRAFDEFLYSFHSNIGGRSNVRHYTPTQTKYCKVKNKQVIATALLDSSHCDFFSITTEGCDL